MFISAPCGPVDGSWDGVGCAPHIHPPIKKFHIFGRLLLIAVATSIRESPPRLDQPYCAGLFLSVGYGYT